MSRTISIECTAELEEGEQCEGTIEITYSAYDAVPMTRDYPGDPAGIEVEDVTECTGCGRILDRSVAEEEATQHEISITPDPRYDYEETD